MTWDSADISSEHLSICLKPEAAYLHCQYFISGELEDEDVLFNACKSSGEGAKFMVLDLCVDETAEITCHHKNAEGSLLQLQKPSCVPWIGSSVDEAFKQFLIKIVGAPVFRKFQKEHTFEAEELLADFKLKKMSLTKESIERVGFKIPVSLLQLFNEDTEENSRCIKTNGIW
ncbi:unnamed protein product [Mytilus edulis]|uniref:Uncharacterized protein n=1 Tax=Mytilus edulis TaxID=6550 RepID=A0A8S3V026_MYTED|nr:unnamed protein product [Mytilus edulis]